MFIKCQKWETEEKARGLYFRVFLNPESYGYVKYSANIQK